MSKLPKLTLTKAVGYKVIAPFDERESRTVGYYNDYNVAIVKSKKCGWFGSDGRVETVDMWLDDDGKFYVFEVEAGTFTDVAQKVEEDLKNSVKSKLTKEELEFLGIKW